MMVDNVVSEEGELYVAYFTTSSRIILHIKLTL